MLSYSTRFKAGWHVRRCPCLHRRSNLRSSSSLKPDQKKSRWTASIRVELVRLCQSHEIRVVFWQGGRILYNIRLFVVVTPK